MARGSEGTKYPPSEFSQKYAPVLAPKGKLVSPKDVFGEDGLFGKDVEDKTRQAWKVTMKKLDKLNTPVEKFKDDLARERIDQVSNAFDSFLIMIRIKIYIEELHMFSISFKQMLKKRPSYTKVIR